ncbi:MAG: cysteine desulfurase NifS [Candidatus Methanomethylophilaceae archaeon]|nr:cysteine desulfurase NifS [Candidatus Methanomethylophilaceae archaeon]
MAPDTIYLDNASTTPLRGEVLDAMLPYLTGEYGNPASIHPMGRTPRDAVAHARESVASLIGADPSEIYFTSGGSESDNWALKSAVLGPHPRGRHVIVSSIEHHAILNTCSHLKSMGVEVTYLPVDRDGLVDPAVVEASIRPDTAVVSVMAANNEIGTIQPIREIGGIARDHGVLFHTDAVQAYGQVDLDVTRDNIDLLSASAHKLGGPKGVGFLYVRKGVHLDPLIHGGEQERGIRGGTTNVPGVVGFGRAAELAGAGMAADSEHERTLRDHLVSRILSEIPYTRLNGHPSSRLPGNANISFAFVEGEALLMSMAMNGICVSTGSACASGSLDPSHVLLAIGLDHATAHGSLRFTVSPRNTLGEIDRTVDVLKEVVGRLRAMSPLYEDHIKNGEETRG